ncbi:ABC transporter substrate-binding protein [Pendulispora albinea]|uniref:ABC transporter substrate-binding protein n=1 Tax=Pendulispora albinea TaxID=2741071 RepID=A0ABZ2M4T1_9BACT
MTLWNGGALAAALLLSTAVAWIPHARAVRADTDALASASPAPATATSASPAPATTPSAGFTDHAGVTIPRAHYARIVSLSTVSDALLLELCEPDRIASFTGYSARGGPESKAHHFQGKPLFEGIKDVEAILQLHPDLVLINTVGDRRPVARLSEAGLPVYELGEMRGLATFVQNIHEVAAILGHPERGRRYAESFVAQMNTVAADIPAAMRKRGLYITTYAGRLYGGGAGTSYHDVLSAAGLVDAAAVAGYRDWPEYTSEQLLTMDPEIVVTNDAMRTRICEHAGLGGLRACASPSSIVELPAALMGDPGSGMLDAALAVRRSVYGAPYDALGARDSETTTTAKGQGR